jgi:hypothetical protein
MFQTVPLSIVRNFSLYTQQRYVSYKFVESFRAWSGWNWVPFWSCCSTITQLVRRLPYFKVSISHTIRHTQTRARAHTHTHTHTPDMAPLNEWSARRKGGYIYNTQRTRETNINGLSGIRTRCPDDQTAAIDRMATRSPISISSVSQVEQRDAKNASAAHRSVIH